MNNYFEELNEKGITSIETSIPEMRELYINGRITFSQYRKVLIHALGKEKFHDIELQLFNEEMSRLIRSYREQGN